MNLFLQLIPNLEEKLRYIVLDFIHSSIDFYPVMFFFGNLFFAFGMIFISYLFGKKIKPFITNDYKNIDLIISIAIGYITIATGIVMLGFFSILTKQAILLYSAVIVFLSIYPFNNLLFELKNFVSKLNEYISHLKSNGMVFVGVFLFVIVALVNLMNPEIREDQYHVDFPKIFTNEKTIMIPPREDLHVSGSSMLSEMYYLPGILFSKETARYIHFLFYILVLITLLEFSNLKSNKYAIYAPLLFATAPIVIHETSSMYVDFQWVYLFLLSIFLVLQAKKNQFGIFFLLGLFMGGMVATKLWTIVLIPILFVFIIHILKIPSLRNILKITILMLCGIYIVSGIWFIRAYILTGNVFFPAFHTFNTLENFRYSFDVKSYFTFNQNLIDPILNINVYSPFLFIGIIFILYNIKNNLKIIRRIAIFKLLILTFIVYLFINYPYGRYLLGIYVILIFLASLGLSNVLNSIPRIKYLCYFLIFSMFCYYFISSLLILPYTLGISDKNKYLSRVLIKDNSSYFDFERKFDKYINKENKVAMYNFHGYYYAEFNFIDINSIYNRHNKSLNTLKKLGVTKLMIRGGDIKWFCNKLDITDCKENQYQLISGYLVYPFYYLYNIN